MQKFTLLAISMICVCLSFVHAQTIFINEIHYDNASSDAGEGVEIAGPASSDLSGWSLVAYNGNGGASYATVNLAGLINDQQGGYGAIFFPLSGLQNGAPDGIALIDASNNVVQFLSYEGSFVAVGGAADGVMSDDIGVSESSSTLLGNSLQLGGSGTTYSDFTWQAELPNTYNTVNTNQIFGTGSAAAPIINEFVFNHDGSDNNEFVEVIGTPNSDYSTYSIIEIEGDGSAAGTVDEVIGLGSTDAQGYWTTGYLSNSFENGTVTLLLVENFTGSFGDDLDTDNDGILDSQPWDSISDDIGTNDGGTSDLNYAVTVLLQGFDGISFTVGGASRIPNGVDNNLTSDWVRNDFSGAGLALFPTVVADPGEAINTLGLDNAVGTAPVAQILINEIDADTQGTDIAEFIELFDGGTGNTALDGLVVVLFNGSNDLSYNAFDLDGFATNADGYFVLGNAGVANVDLTFGSNGLQNGADAVALYAGDATDFPNGTPVATESLIDAIVYDTNDSDDAGLSVLLNMGEPQVNEDSNGAKDTESLGRIPNGAGGERNTSSFVALAPTPGAENGAVVIPELITITEARAASIDQVVTVRGVITVAGEFGGPAFIQDETGGIAVFDAQLHANTDFQIGDSIEITAVRAEFNLQVQLSGITNIIDLGVANVPVSPKQITLSELGDFAGELVSVVDASFPTPGDLLFGNSNYQLTDASGTGELRLDNQVTSLVGKAQPAVCDTIIGVVGRFQSVFQLLPRLESDLPCAEEFEPTGDDLSIPRSETFDIVTWNIEWFGDENNSPAAGDPNSDQIQKDSVKTVLLGLDADVIAVQEITDTTLFTQLVAELPGYDFFLSDFVSRPNDPGEKQRVGFIYNSATVIPDFAASRALLVSIHPLYNGGDDSALVGYPSTTDRFYASGRLPYLLVVDATINGVSKRLDIINLHARANSSSDAQNRYDMRKYDVEVLKDTLDAYFSDSDLILLGDYNDDVDFTVADIASTLTSYEVFVTDTTNYNPVTVSLSEAGFRSFVFRENVIDHITISNELFESYIEGSSRVGYEYYDNDYSSTVSDHLPVSARLLFEPEITFNTSQAVEVVEFNQGKRRNGRPVVWWRSIPEKALGEPLENYYFNFVSLGFGGDITLRLEPKLYDLEGDDFKVFESTFGPLNIPCRLYPEKAEVLVSDNGIDFVSLGQTCLDGKFDLASVDLEFIEYIKIVDVSNPQNFFGNADGYDVDGIWPINPSGIAGRSANTLQDHENYAPNEEGEIEVVAYPNPFNDRLKLNLVFEDENDRKLKFYNAMGALTYEYVVPSEEGYYNHELDLSHLPHGLYFMKITGAGDQVERSVKLIKK
ncbi:MAG: endonuclease/exonuclease/phosphatase family protein [Bacteroidota bacterium]